MSELDPVQLLTAVAHAVLKRPDGVFIASAHFFDGSTIAELADQYNMKRSTLHARLDRLWRILEHSNAVPHGWTRQAPGHRTIDAAHTTFANDDSRGRDFDMTDSELTRRSSVYPAYVDEAGEGVEDA